MLYRDTSGITECDHDVIFPSLQGHAVKHLVYPKGMVLKSTRLKSVSVVEGKQRRWSRSHLLGTGGSLFWGFVWSKQSSALSGKKSWYGFALPIRRVAVSVGASGEKKKKKTEHTSRKE